MPNDTLTETIIERQLDRWIEDHGDQETRVVLINMLAKRIIRVNGCIAAASYFTNIVTNVLENGPALELAYNKERVN